MAKKNKNIIQLSVEQFDDLLWPAYRYCLSRRSYANSYVRDYWQIIRKNKDKFDKERLAFLARDVRSYITDTLRWSANIHTEGESNCCIVKDAYSLLVEYLSEHPECNPETTEFYIDCVNCTVVAREWEPEPPRVDTNGQIVYQPTAYKPEDDYSYLSDYVNFANCLDREYECVCEKGDEREVCDVVESPLLRIERDPDTRDIVSRKWGKEWVCTTNWNRHPCEKYIKSVTPKF